MTAPRRHPWYVRAILVEPDRVEFVAVLGEDEIASGTVSLKHMDSGDQRSVPRSELAGALG